jgi:catechol 2,3-dioxygenase-like lactoylglutathione lyase family enzyme
MRAERIFEACLYTDDLPAAKEFYTRVMGLEVASDFSKRGIAFRCGSGVVIVFDRKVCQFAEGGIPGHGTTGVGHVAFALEGDDLQEWRQHLQKCGITTESEVDWPSGGKSVYFRDPAGNLLELAPPTLWGLR